MGATIAEKLVHRIKQRAKHETTIKCETEKWLKITRTFLRCLIVKLYCSYHFILRIYEQKYLYVFEYR